MCIELCPRNYMYIFQAYMQAHFNVSLCARVRALQCLINEMNGIK